MRRRFVPNYYKQNIPIKLKSLKQGKRSVEKYDKDFETLMFRCKPKESLEEPIARFINGLKFDIASMVKLQHYQILENVIRLENIVKSHQHMQSQKSSSYHYKSNDVGDKDNEKGLEKDDNKVKAQEEKEPEPAQQRKNRDIKCYKCLHYGHIASQCPNMRVMIMKDGVVKSEEDDK